MVLYEEQNAEEGFGDRQTAPVTRVNLSIYHSDFSVIKFVDTAHDSAKKTHIKGQTDNREHLQEHTATPAICSIIHLSKKL